MTRMQLEGAGAEELEDLSARIEAELTRRALAERGGARRSAVGKMPNARWWKNIRDRAAATVYTV